jgi:hypothetical protein
MAKSPSVLSPEFESASATILAAAKKELQIAAKAHGVKIQASELAYVSLEKMTIALVPIAGSAEYQDADFQAGAPLQLIIVKATRGDIPSGSYLVKAQFRPRAKSGKAIFTDRSGKVVIERDLLVRTREQSAVLFPDVYSDTGPQLLPTINSWHFFTSGPKMNLKFDAAGWKPYRIIWY